MTTRSSPKALTAHHKDMEQWPRGELGEVLAQRIIPERDTGREPALDHDSSTNTLIRRYRMRKDAKR